LEEVFGKVSKIELRKVKEAVKTVGLKFDQSVEKKIIINK
jgi:predicted HAD superfamily phosphohydrolase